MKCGKLWIALTTFAAGLCILAIIILERTARPGVTAELYQGGVLLDTIPLSEPVSFTLEAPNGGSNTVTVEGGRICVSHATCPDQICVKQGWIGHSAAPIVCLPNQLVIQIKGGEASLDAATGP